MTLRLLFLTLPVILLACARPLTDQEADFAKALLGDDLQTRNVSVHNGAFIGNIKHTRPTRPRLACRERIWPAPKSKTVEVGTAAFVLFNKVFMSRPLYLKNYMESYPERISLARSMLFAHEMTHVWQWQNRKLTSYHPLKAANEHKPGTDPYLFELGTQARFLDYPYEQQGGIVEEYVCCTTLDPKGSRTARLRRMLSVHFPVLALDQQLAQSRIHIPWKGAKTKGICS